MKKIAAFLILVTFFYGCEKYPKNDFAIETIQYNSIAGINSDDLSLDIYHYNDANNHPILIWVHGGGWAIGDKENKIDTKLNWAFEKGYILISVNYRLSGTDVALDEPGRIEFPDHPNDIADALKWIYNNITSYGGDTSNIVIFGHSAGAHLVSLVATDTSYLTQRNLPLNIIKGVGSFDTQGYDVQKLLESDPSDIYLNAFGIDPIKWPLASPINYVGANNIYQPNFFIVTRGGSDRKKQANDFNDQLINAGHQSTIIDADNYSHSKINKMIGNPNDKKFMSEFDAFLEMTFE